MCGNSVRVVTQLQPREVGLRGSDPPPLLCQGGLDPGTFGNENIDPALKFLFGSQRGHSGCLRHVGDGKGHRDLAQALLNFLARDGVPQPQSREAVGLGEGVQHGHVLEFTKQIDAAGGRRVVLKVHVRLIHHHENALRNLREEIVQGVVIDRGASRVVWCAHKDDAGLVGDGREHGG